MGIRRPSVRRVVARHHPLNIALGFGWAAAARCSGVSKNGVSTPASTSSAVASTPLGEGHAERGYPFRTVLADTLRVQLGTLASLNLLASLRTLRLGHTVGEPGRPLAKFSGSIQRNQTTAK